MKNKPLILEVYSPTRNGMSLVAKRIMAEMIGKKEDIEVQCCHCEKTIKVHRNKIICPNCGKYPLKLWKGDQI